ncbi:hypothetical protein Tco_1512369, partial [Tanacetum coccineum]
DCKFLLDKNELQHSVGTEDHEKTRLDKANAVIDIMSSPLSLVAQINVTDRMHILKVSLLLQGQAIVPMQLVAHVTANLFYWPLIQLAAATTHNIVLGVSVGSKGGGNLPGATSNITLLLLLIGKCTADPNAFTEVGREDFFRNLHLQNHRALFISSSRPEPESFESSNEVNQHGEALVIEIPHTKDVSSGSDCFESVNSQLLGN